MFRQTFVFDPRFLHSTVACNVFGSDLVIRGCLYYLCQSTFFKVQKLHLKMPYFHHVFNSIIKNDQTNNTCEVWNSRFMHLVGHSHLTIWVLIRKN